jgi:hypothetical protein
MYGKAGKAAPAQVQVNILFSLKPTQESAKGEGTKRVR